MKSFNRIFKNEYAQTLLELTIVAGLTIMVISAVSISSVIGLRNSQFAQNQSAATKLAEDGIEKIRSLRGRNWSVCLSSVDSKRWGELYSTPSFNASEVILKTAPSSICPGITNGQQFLFATSASLPDLSPTSDSPFTRRLYLEKLSPNEIKVTSRVTWSDYSGSHNSELVTIFTKP